MYHIVELKYCKTQTYTITNNITDLVDRFSLLGVTVRSRYCDYDFEVVKEEWLGGYGENNTNYPEKVIHLLVNGKVYSDPYEACYALDSLAPRLLGWRVRRFGDRLGLLGVYLRRRRQARRSRRRERRIQRAARRVERRAKRSERRKPFWNRLRGKGL